MKIGRDGIEGSPEEIKDFVENHGLDIEDYFPSTRKDPNITPFSLIVLSVVFLVFCIFQGVTGIFPILIFVILSIFYVLLVSFMTHLKYNNNWVFLGIILGGLTMGALSTGFISPAEFFNKLREIPIPGNSIQ